MSEVAVAPIAIARLIDDRSRGGLVSNLGTRWRLVSDAVMGGLSDGELVADTVDGRDCLRLRGRVSLENNGGFLQAALDLSAHGEFDASAYAGVVLDVFGNGQSYNVHLRTGTLTHPWQAYRAGFDAPERWQRVLLPFAAFAAHRTDAAFDPRRLRRIGIVAIGRAFDADLCVARVGFAA